MVNNSVNRYTNLVTFEKKPELFNQIPKKEISYEELEKVSQQHAGEIIRITKNLADTARKVKNLEVTILKQTTDFKKNLDKQKSISNLLVFSQWQAYYSQQEFLALKRWFWGFIGVAWLIIVGWIFETYHRFWEVKSEYIRQTEQLNNIISEQKREMEKITDDYNKSKEDNKKNLEELQYLRSRIDNLIDQRYN